MEITRTAKNTMPEQVQENMGNIDALNNEFENRPVGLIDKGDWTRGRHYYPQQVVQYNGASYLCTRSIISYATPDTDPAHFKLFAVGIQGEQGETGNGIASITKISTVGLVDTYRITFTDGTTYDYTVTNGQNGTNGTNGQDGNGIASITKISTVGLVDTYRITFTDGTTYDYTVTNGQNGTDGANPYPIGARLIVDDANYDPASLFGGTWALQWTKTFVENAGSVGVYGTPDGKSIRFRQSENNQQSLVGVLQPKSPSGNAADVRYVTYSGNISGYGSPFGLIKLSQNESSGVQAEMSTATNTTTLFCWERTA